MNQSAVVIITKSTKALRTRRKSQPQLHARRRLTTSSSRSFRSSVPKRLGHGIVWRVRMSIAPRNATGSIAIDPLASENDNSLVLVLGYAGRRVLFAGDIEAEGEAALVAAGPEPVDVLKVPHHGSRTSSSKALLAALRPRLAVASLAAGNRYRFPHPDVVARYRAREVPLYRTDRDGALSLRIAADGELELRCARPAGCGVR